MDKRQNLAIGRHTSVQCWLAPPHSLASLAHSLSSHFWHCRSIKNKKNKVEVYLLESEIRVYNLVEGGDSVSSTSSIQHCILGRRGGWRPRVNGIQHCILGMDAIYSSPSASRSSIVSLGQVSLLPADKRAPVLYSSHNECSRADTCVAPCRCCCCMSSLYTSSAVMRTRRASLYSMSHRLYNCKFAKIKTPNKLITSHACVYTDSPHIYFTPKITI